MATAPLTSSAVSLLEAAEDRRLLGLSLSERQRELLALLETHPLVVCAAGRQSGKSLLAAALLVHNLLLRPDLDALAGRSPRYGLAIANSQVQAGITLAYGRAFVESSRLLRAQLVSASETALSFKGGRILHALPCSDRLQRGLSASAVVLDEFAHFVHATDGPRIAERIWTAIRPTVSVYGTEARTLAISTPGDSPLFERLHVQAGNGELGEGAAAFQASTQQMNPRVSADFLEAERVLLGPDFAREYEATFVAGAASFLSMDELRDVTGKFTQLGPDDVTGSVVGLDPAFSSDPSAAVVVGRSRQDRRRLLVARVERWAPKRPRHARRAAKTQEQRDEVANVVLDGVAALSKLFGGAPVVTDQHLPGVVKEGLRERGVDQVIVTAWTGKLLTEAFQAVRARVIAQTIELPRHELMLSELTKVRTRMRSGASVVEVPRTVSSHMDCALALAAAVLRLETRGVSKPARISSSFEGRAPTPLFAGRDLEEMLSRPPMMGLR